MPSSEVKYTIISKAFDKWAEKKWFQIIIAISIIYLLLIPIISPIIYNEINKKNTGTTIEKTLDARDEKQKEIHRLRFEQSKIIYANSKALLNNYLNYTNANYIFFIEYHNGLENIMNGVQFCRFDITLEAIESGYKQISREKFKDDIVARYDLLLSQEFSNSSKVFVYDIDSLYNIDKYLYQQLLFINANECALINVTDDDDIIIGTLLFVNSNNTKLNALEIYKCMLELKKIIKLNLEQ